MNTYDVGKGIPIGGVDESFAFCIRRMDRNKHSLSVFLAVRSSPTLVLLISRAGMR
jgi:hypothetical protein